MNKRRLLRFAKLLEDDAKNDTGIKFNMSLWGKVENRREPLSCGTQACAMGLAALSGVFEKAGLDYQFRQDGKINFLWKGSPTNGYYAGAELFGLSDEQAGKLFTPNGVNQQGAKAERAKARQIRRMVARAS